jgi:hypothetical protein
LPSRDGLGADAIAASQVTTESAPARILSDAYVVVVLDIGSSMSPPFHFFYSMGQLLFSTTSPSSTDEELG